MFHHIDPHIEQSIRRILSDRDFMERIFGIDVRSMVDKRCDRIENKFDNRIDKLQLEIPKYVSFTLQNDQNIKNSFNSIMEDTLRKFQKRADKHFEEVDDKIRKHPLSKRQIEIIGEEVREQLRKEFKGEMENYYYYTNTNISVLGGLLASGLTFMYFSLKK